MMVFIAANSVRTSEILLQPKLKVFMKKSLNLKEINAWQHLFIFTNQIRETLSRRWVK